MGLDRFSNPRLSKLWKFIKARYAEPNPAGEERVRLLSVNDIDHITRATKYAQMILRENKSANKTLVLAAVMCHDLGYFSGGEDGHEHATLDMCVTFLKKAGFSYDEVAVVQKILSYEGGSPSKATLEQKIVFLADKLCRLGKDGAVRLLVYDGRRATNIAEMAARRRKKTKTLVRDELLPLGIARGLIRKKLREALKFYDELCSVL